MKKYKNVKSMKRSNAMNHNLFGNNSAISYKYVHGMRLLDMSKKKITGVVQSIKENSLNKKNSLPTKGR